MKIPKRRHGRFSGVFIVKLNIFHIFFFNCVSVFNFEQVNVCCAGYCYINILLRNVYKVEIVISSNMIG